MYWNKNLILLMLSIFLFTGCAGEVASSLLKDVAGGSLSIGYDLDGEKPLFLESIDNKDFQEFILNNKLVEGSKKKDILYLDNGNNRNKQNPYSRKILLTKDVCYIIDVSTWQYLTRLNKNNYQKFDYDIWKYPYQKWNIKTKISEDTLTLTFRLKDDAKSYEYVINALKMRTTDIKHRFNDIEKIKEIIDERVAYYKNLENNENKK